MEQNFPQSRRTKWREVNPRLMKDPVVFELYIVYAAAPPAIVVRTEETA